MQPTAVQRDALVLGWLAGVVVLASGEAWSINPLDDDAGSGGDASDKHQFALPLGRGAYQGNLTNPIDIGDVYSFQARNGDIVRVGLDSAESMILGLFAPVNGDPEPCLEDVVCQPYSFLFAGQEKKLLLPFEGTWFVIVRGEGPAGTRIPYWLTILPAEAAQAVILPLEGLAGAELEIQWTKPSAIRVTFFTTGPVDPRPPYSALDWGQWDTGDGRISRATHVGGDALGTAVSVVPPGLTVLPPDEGLPAGMDRGEGMTGWWKFDEPSGWARFTVYQTQGRGALVFLADEPVEFRTAHLERVIVWNTAGGGSDLQVVAPAVSVTGPRELHLAVADRFVGFFTRWCATWASVTGPDGQAVPMADGSLFLEEPARGNWVFTLGPTVGGAFGASAGGPGQDVVSLCPADAIFLDGVFAPPLGLVPP